MRSFEEIPDIAERIKRSKMELQESGFYWAPEWDSQSCCDQDYVNNFKKGWESRQTEVDELQKRVDAITERLDEGISAIRKSAEIYEDHFSGYPESDYLRGLANDLEQALKGGEA